MAYGTKTRKPKNKTVVMIAVGKLKPKNGTKRNSKKKTFLKNMDLKDLILQSGPLKVVRKVRSVYSRVGSPPYSLR